MSGEQDVPVKEKPNARRKLELEDDTSDGENTGENDVAVKSPPPPPLTKYEKHKIHNLEENEKVYRKLGLPSLVSTFKHDVAQSSKGRGKNGKSKKGKDIEPEHRKALVETHTLVSNAAVTLPPRVASNTEIGTSHPHPQLWQGKPSTTESSIIREKLKDHEMTIESSTMSISSVYSQELSQNSESFNIDCSD
ncbi:hypothetical protein POM88_021928 [Heracleum sosnowskyi]|uniref:Uncharacterized protein n=1 Tax=Heracleum sosnowskyi TaxID=360622 RepID=A0AAD8IGT5_9APIA|nr:hypothetical protein POM88_021928 [Heracleum sosnowskyi]